MIKLNRHVETASIFCKTPIFGILLIFLTISLLNIPIIITLWRHSFDDGTYSHAYLIPIISLYLFYIAQKTGKLTFRKRTSPFATVIFALSCISLFLTSNAQISLGYWCSLLALLVTSINMLYRFNGYIVFPSIFFIFILPVWGVLTPLLQNISVKAVTLLMSLTGIPTFVENQLITIPAGVFEIAGGCSGLRYIIVSLAISSLFIFLYINTFKKALGFFTLAILGAFITNWLRITLLILIGEYTNMESSLMEDHNTFGWYLFIPFMMILFWWGNNIIDIDLTAPQSNAQSTAKNSSTTQVEASPSKLSLVVCLSLLCFSSTSLSSMLVPDDDNNITDDASFEIKPIIHFYSSVARRLDIVNSTVQLTYFFSGKELDGKPSYYENELIPVDWNIVSEEVSSHWRTWVITNRRQNAIILTRFEIDEELIIQNKKLKLTRLLKAAKNISQTKLHWFFIPCNTDCQEELKGF